MEVITIPAAPLAFSLSNFANKLDTYCSDIVKVDSQKELTQSTFLFFIL